MAMPHTQTPCAPCAKKRQQMMENARRAREAIVQGNLKEAAAATIETAKTVVEGAAMLTGVVEKK